MVRGTSWRMASKDSVSGRATRMRPIKKDPPISQNARRRRSHFRWVTSEITLMSRLLLDLWLKRVVMNFVSSGFPENRQVLHTRHHNDWHQKIPSLHGVFFRKCVNEREPRWKLCVRAR